MIGSAATADDDGSFTAWDGYITGRTLEQHPHWKIVQAWRTTEFPDDAPDSLLTVLLEPEDSGTRVTLRHEQIPDGQGPSYEVGWQDHYFDPMTSYFQTTGSRLKEVGNVLEEAADRASHVLEDAAEQVEQGLEQATGQAMKAVDKARAGARKQALKAVKAVKKARKSAASSARAVGKKVKALVKRTKKPAAKKKAAPKKKKVAARKAAAPKKKRPTVKKAAKKKAPARKPRRR